MNCPAYLKKTLVIFALSAFALSGLQSASKCDDDPTVVPRARAVKADPKNVLHHFNLAIAYYNNKCYDEAISAFKKTLKTNKNDKRKHMRMWTQSVIRYWVFFIIRKKMMTGKVLIILKMP